LSTEIPNPLSIYSTIYLFFSISNAVYPKNTTGNLLVSPLLVAGVVIGLVLFLSCVTIIVGSLRKDGRLRHPHQRRDAVYAPDGFSYGGSFGELRSTCMEEFPPAFDFGSYLDTLSQVNIMYPDSPPRYDECVGPGATQMYIPTDDPPPYSLMDPCQGNEISINISLEEEEASGTTGQAANYAVRLQDLQQPISSISLSSLTLEAAPLYETVVCEQNIPIPLVPVKESKPPQGSEGAQTQNQTRSFGSIKFCIWREAS
uniref:Brain expressed associated with NEDD4 1 n=1 Tax=Anas platyrhynchos platyrhynchos TaxID=8840 RepID=U3J477_ANAPP